MNCYSCPNIFALITRSWNLKQANCAYLIARPTLQGLTECQLGIWTLVNVPRWPLDLIWSHEHGQYVLRMSYNVVVARVVAEGMTDLSFCTCCALLIAPVGHDSVRLSLKENGHSMECIRCWALITPCNVHFSLYKGLPEVLERWQR